MTRKIILAGAAAFALAALALTAAYFYIPGGARLVFGEGDIRICLNADGTAELDWPEARPSSRTEPQDGGGEDAPAGEAAGTRITPVLYDLELTSESGHTQKLENHPHILLENYTLPMTIRIQAVAEGKNLLGLFRRQIGRASCRERV